MLLAPELGDTDVLHSVEVQSHPTCELPPLVHKPFVDDNVCFCVAQVLPQFLVVFARSYLVLTPRPYAWFVLHVVHGHTCCSTWIECYNPHVLFLDSL